MCVTVCQNLTRKFLKENRLKELIYIEFIKISLEACEACSKQMGGFITMETGLQS